MSNAIHMEGVGKNFDGNDALKGAWFKAGYGQLHALLGENGAGKTTLMNVLCGLYAPDEGRILFEEAQVDVSGPAQARSLGIGMVHQNFKLVPPFTVAENVMLANPRASWSAGIREVKDEIRNYCLELGFTLDVDATVDSISVSEQQRIEIIKVLMGGAKILILDEPTAVLTDEEGDRVLKMARDLASRGTCVVLITHKLREVLEYADWVTVMRGGRTVASQNPEGMTQEQLTELMVGKAALDETLPSAVTGEIRLEVQDLFATRADGVQTVNDLSLVIRSGQIYGVAGVGGNGQPELAEVLMGVRAASGGRITLDGAEITSAHPRQRRRAGLASIPADRYVFGLAANLSVTDNFSVSGLDNGRFGGSYWVAKSGMRQATRGAIDAFEIHGAVPATRARLLSGGNAQKLVLARELSGDPGVIVAHSPTRGLDVRACAAVHSHLRQARDSGAAVLLISEDLDEVMNLSDRIGVITRGRIVGEFDNPADRQQVGKLMVDHA